MSDKSERPELVMTFPLPTGETYTQNIQLAEFRLFSGKVIPIQHVKMSAGNPSQDACNSPWLKDAGMPMDIDRWFLTIDGKG
ncbi:MAG: hypothetical protein WBV94_31910 [Blastocatellia bacterium]